MKKICTAICLLLLSAGAQAQEAGIGGILTQIEKNNRELQADKQQTAVQKLEQKVENNLPDPTVSYAHLWDSDDKNITVGELVVAQSFDFPTLYITRAKMNRLKGSSLNAQAEERRREILLQAQEVCLDIIALHRKQLLLDERMKNAEELSTLYTQRLESGDASILETNKLGLELLNVRTEARLNRSALDNKIRELMALNGHSSLVPGRPLPDLETPSAELLGLTEYPTTPLPVDFRPLCDELLASDAALQALNSESLAARKQVSAGKQGWLPKLEVGYRRNTEDGHPLNGIIVGASIPLFENRSKVKIAKAEAAAIDYRKEEEQIKAHSRLWQLYDEATALNSSIQEYTQTLASQQDLTLLKQALEGGEISLIEYFVEVSVVYQSKANLIELENNYEKTMARLYKSRL